MADKSNPPSVKIGHYKLGDTLGTGTFGKVKGELKFMDACRCVSTSYQVLSICFTCHFIA